MVLIFSILSSTQKGSANFYFLLVHAILVPWFNRVYTHTYSLSLLLPYLLIIKCWRFLFSTTVLFIFVTFIYINGFCRVTMTQAFLFLGLSYSSPILVCAMSHLVPTFNFLLSLILRFLIIKTHSFLCLYYLFIFAIYCDASKYFTREGEMKHILIFSLPDLIPVFHHFMLF